ncbi:uncharacterized protein K02A2.6-like [Centruroides sculpturatus]|uniref:uncharacterized protein K02A2.6-like n=1 Tax=Centruroides sculpturatus TaxID=218467 RepID=UPI000C6D8F3F|nr:uncharacterized protein K02A2.6-like [Centruroides sculpturatus]
MKITDTKFIELAENTRQDQSLQTVKKYLSEGWPVHKKSIPSNIKPYYDFKEDLYLWKNIICKGPAIIIPEKQRTRVLQQIHAAHLGINASLSRVRNKVYWPGMNHDIEKVVKSCRQCQRFRPAQTKEPLIPHRIPTYPWQEATADIFYLASSPYLLIVDRYSAYPEIYKMPSTDASKVIPKFKETFSRFGSPEILMTDNGPPFSSVAFNHFCDKWSIRHSTSSPRYPQSNGHIE